jgi:integrase
VYRRKALHDSQRYRKDEEAVPRPRKSARLWLRPARPSVGRQAMWVILDNGKHHATGCAASETVEAEKRLADYISDKYHPSRQKRAIDNISTADVLAIYLEDKGSTVADEPKLERCIGRLNDFFGDKTLSQLSAKLCRDYVDYRRKIGGARSDLETLRAAINHHAKENLHDGNVRVSLPPKGAPRDRWLTRQEAARLLHACWNYREVQTVHIGRHKGEKTQTAKYPLRHLAKFILIGLYTGTRASAIMAASPYRDEGHAFVDLDHGIFYRLAQGKRVTKKRQPPAPIPQRLLAHMRRWQRKGLTTHFVEWQGAPVKSVKTAFNHATKLAKLSGRVTPHTLRHTAATWLMQRGTPLWEASGYLGMSAKVLEETYGHHHPDHLRGAAVAITQRVSRTVSLDQSLVVGRQNSSKGQKSQ